MKITALEIEQRQFEKSFRGYDIEEVNRFLANMAAEWERMTNESTMLKMQLEISEKEASKLREVEHTLVKTLKTAEEASSKIAESAKHDASRKIEDAEAKANQIVSVAQNSANQIIAEAEQKSISMQSLAKEEFKDLDTKHSALEKGKDALVAQLTQISKEAAKLANVPVLEKQLVTKTQQAQEIKLETAAIEKTIAPEIVEEHVYAPEPEPVAPVQEETEEPVGISFSSEANKISLDTNSEKHNLEIIEGIGPKIKEVLNSARIHTFRDLANTPIYKIKDVLDAAGPHYAAHDPSTWVEQALLADAGEWAKLDTLKEILVGGRAPKQSLSDIVPTRMTEGGNTEEMLDKVNKVKAAIRKSMIEKSENSQPVTNNQGSFFDNINL